jgi:hypothetical protein
MNNNNSMNIEKNKYFLGMCQKIGLAEKTRYEKSRVPVPLMF